MGGGHHEGGAAAPGELLDVEGDDLGGGAVQGAAELVGQPELLPGVDHPGDLVPVSLAVAELVVVPEE